MKKIIAYAATAIALICAALSCTSSHESEISAGGLGAVSFNIKTDNSVTVVGSTRASADPEDYTVKIYSTEGLIYLFEGLDNVPEKLWLKSGDYTVRVKAGDSSILASGPYYEGESDFRIGVGPATVVPVTCYIAGTLLSVNFDASIKDNFSSYRAKHRAQRHDGDTVRRLFGKELSATSVCPKNKIQSTGHSTVQPSLARHSTRQV